MNTLIATSRRYSRDRWHPYGWEVSFRQRVRLADGQIVRKYFAALGVDRNAAIANALGQVSPYISRR